MSLLFVRMKNWLLYVKDIETKVKTYLIMTNYGNIKRKRFEKTHQQRKLILVKRFITAVLKLFKEEIMVMITL